MFYEVLMEKRAENEDKKKRLKASVGTALLGAGSAAASIGLGRYATDKVIKNSKPVRDLIYRGIDRKVSGKSRLEMTKMINKMRNRRGNAVFAGGLLGGGLGTYAAYQAEKRYNNRNK